MRRIVKLGDAIARTGPDKDLHGVVFSARQVLPSSLKKRPIRQRRRQNRGVWGVKMHTSITESE